MKITSLKNRKDFVDIAKNGKNVASKSLVLQVREKHNSEDKSLQVGFTATKKLGNAVIRNRVKRRLRAVVAEIMPKRAKLSFDYVVIGRKSAIDRDYNDIIKDLKYTLHSTNTHK